VCILSANTRQVIQGGTWNCQAGRGKGGGEYVADVVGTLLLVHNLDFLVLQEAKNYIRQIRAAVALLGYTVIGSRDWDTVVVVRSSKLGPHSFLRLPHKWFGWKVRRWHLPRTIPRVKVDWLVVRGIHAPPGNNWKRGKISGKRDRKRAFIGYMSALLRLAGALLPQALIGDWNCNRDDRGRWSTRWFASKIRGEVVGPKRIDHGVVRGCTTGAWRQLPKYGSAHNAYVFTVWPK
jgi:hypothetical protein